jgi:amino acid transporter
MAYSFLGVESVCITAFEARDVHSLRNPSRWIAWVILFIYAFTLIAEFLVFSWMDPNLPAIYGADKGSIPLAANSGKLAMAVVALDYAGHWNLASFINAGCVFSALSASNAALYVASRTLYGLARNTPEKRTPMSRIFKKFSHTTDNTRVPALALFVSMIAFVWLPFLTNIQNGDTVQLVSFSRRFYR